MAEHHKDFVGFDAFGDGYIRVGGGKYQIPNWAAEAIIEESKRRAAQPVEIDEALQRGLQRLEELTEDLVRVGFPCESCDRRSYHVTVYHGLKGTAKTVSFCSPWEYDDVSHHDQLAGTLKRFAEWMGWLTDTRNYIGLHTACVKVTHAGGPYTEVSKYEGKSTTHEAHAVLQALIKALEAQV